MVSSKIQASLYQMQTDLFPEATIPVLYYQSEKGKTSLSNLLQFWRIAEKVDLKKKSDWKVLSQKNWKYHLGEHIFIFSELKASSKSNACLLENVSCTAANMKHIPITDTDHTVMSLFYIFSHSSITEHSSEKAVGLPMPWTNVFLRNNRSLWCFTNTGGLKGDKSDFAKFKNL